MTSSPCPLPLLTRKVLQRILRRLIDSFRTPPPVAALNVSEYVDHVDVVKYQRNAPGPRGIRCQQWQREIRKSILSPGTIAVFSAQKNGTTAPIESIHKPDAISAQLVECNKEEDTPVLLPPECSPHTCRLPVPGT